MRRLICTYISSLIDRRISEFAQGRGKVAGRRCGHEKPEAVACSLLGAAALCEAAAVARRRLRGDGGCRAASCECSGGPMAGRISDRARREMHTGKVIGTALNPQATPPGAVWIK